MGRSSIRWPGAKSISHGKQRQLKAKNLNEEKSV